MRHTLLLLVLVCGCRSTVSEPDTHTLFDPDGDGDRRACWVDLLAACAPAADAEQRARERALLDGLLAEDPDLRAEAYDALLAEGARAAVLVREIDRATIHPELAFRLDLLEEDLWEVSLPTEVFVARDLTAQPPTLPAGFVLEQTSLRDGLELSVRRGERTLLTWRGSRETPVLVVEGLLYTARADPASGRTRIVAFDLEERRLVWHRDVFGGTPTFDHVGLKLCGARLAILLRRVRRDPSLGVVQDLQIVQLVDRENGRMLLHRDSGLARFPHPFDARARPVP